MLEQTLPPIYDYKDTTVSSGLFAAPNLTAIAFPCGAFGDTIYQPLQFVEAAIDVTALVGEGTTGECGRLPFESLFIKTKSSASPTATLKDFINPLQVNICFDVTPPTIGGQGANGIINCPATPSFTAPTAQDNCGSATVSVLSDVTTAGSCPGSYSRRVTWQALDACGNSATVSQTITVLDNLPPTIGSAGANFSVSGCPATATFGSLGFSPPTLRTDVEDRPSTSFQMLRPVIIVQKHLPEHGTQPMDVVTRVAQ
jgi:hypothetical protein